MSVKATPANILSSVEAILVKYNVTAEDISTIPVTAKYAEDAKKAGITSVLVTSSKDPSTPKGSKPKYPVTDELGNKLVNVCKRTYEPITLGEFEAETHKKDGTPRGQAFKAANPTLNKHQLHKAFMAQYKDELATELAARKALYKHHSMRLYSEICKAQGKIFNDDTGNWIEDPVIKEAAKQAKLAAKQAKNTPTPTPTTPTPTDGNESDESDS